MDLNSLLKIASSIVRALTCGLCCNTPLSIGDGDHPGDDVGNTSGLHEPLLDGSHPSASNRGNENYIPPTAPVVAVNTKNMLGLGHRDVNEDYELGRLLGQGAYAVVCRSKNKKTGQEYACKTILKSKLKRRADVEDIRREVQILMLLSGHPNVAALVGIYEDDQAVHMILELCKGGELVDSLIQQGSISERDVAKAFRSMVLVVQHCHTLGIMHRDIKPENFLLSEEGPKAVVKAADFGLSQFFRPGRSLHSLVGSAHFVAPEVVLRKYGPAADIWSLGVCLYILLTGLTPFWGNTEEEVLAMVLHADVDFEVQPWPSISRRAKDLVQRLLTRNPAKRPTPDQILQHAWLCQAASDAPLDPVVLERIRATAVAVRVKRAAMLAASQGLTPEHLPRLHSLFEVLDIDQNGALSAEELRVGLQRLNLPIPKGGIDALVKSADQDGDGQISMHEFLAACLGASSVAQQEFQGAILQQVDTDADGKVSAGEICGVLGKYGVKESDMAAVLSVLDKDEEGFIRIEDFSKWLACHTNSLQTAVLEQQQRQKQEK